VATSGGTSAPASGDRFTYTVASAPSVTGISPNSGSTGGGTTITVTGSGFTGATGVTFGGTPASNFAVLSDTSLTAVVPAEPAGTVDVQVMTYAGSSAVSSSDHYTYNATAAPAVTALSSSSGSTAGGTQIVITGSGLTGATGVSFGSTAASNFWVNGDTQIIAIAPAAPAGQVDVQVTTYGGTSAVVAADKYTYTAAPAPTVSGVSPASGGVAGGNYVMVTGTGFTGATGVTFGSLAATSFTVLADTALVAVAPPEAAGTLDVKVTTYGGTSGTSSADHYTYNCTSAPAPQVTGVTPNTGTTAGNTTVTVSGSNFFGATAVKFGGTAATSFVVNPDGSITATSPAGSAGTVDLTVTTPAGTSATSSNDQFTYVSASLPAVTGVSPSSGSTNGTTAVTITGSNLSGATVVTFGGVPAASFTVVSGTQITTTAPAQAAGTVDVRVTTAAGQSAVVSGDQFTYAAAALPVVTGLSPMSGSGVGGNSVMIGGSNFTGATAVFFGGTPATSFTVNSSSQISAVVPAHAAGTFDVRVSNYSGTSAASSGDRYTYSAATPAVTGVTPNTGSTAGGTSVTIGGNNFSGATAVSFGGVPATSFTVNTVGTITATAPAQAAGTVDVIVTAPGGTTAVVAADHFTYTAAAAPVVTGVSPNTGSTGGGTAVTVSGTGFIGASGVTFGGVAAAYTVNSDTSITATAPPEAAGVVDVQVTTPSGTSAVVSADHFTYTAAAAPAVTGVTPASGSAAGGSVVAVLGSGFTGASAVSFGTAAAVSFTVVSDGALYATAPAGTAGTVDITVTTPTGTSSTSSADHFTYTAVPVPSMTGVSPGSGSTGGGTVVTLTGSNFTNANGVFFNGVAAASFVVFSDTQVQAVAPPQAAGTVDVTVSSYGGTSATSSATRYTYNAAAAPAVTAVSPPSGSTAGGTSVTLTGTAFTGATAVSFGGVAATSFTVTSDTQIVATAPAQAAGTIDIVVTTPSGTSAVGTADHYTYTAAAAPAV
jgi:hypothetical protein